jgi:hypothetical protein
MWNHNRIQPLVYQGIRPTFPEEIIVNKITSSLCASALALSFGLATILPVNAAAVFVPRQAEVSTAIQNIQFDQKWRRKGVRAQDRMDWRQGRRDIRSMEGRYMEGRYERRGNRSYYNGHRGFDRPRHGYRQHNGMWFPAAAFITGAIIGGALSQSNDGHNGHVAWCHDRYRSYRASDNTYQPYDGPRQECFSPRG